ncbi:MAG: cation-transporting P-type ATPase [Candidatus Sericytochromatia bacterium]|nr:cation-transporting P-type ATPase [Candidatus Tanganyikabacteria bacterium]
MAIASDPTRGLSTAQAQALLAEFGPNALPVPRGRSVWNILWAQMRSFIVLLLLLAAVVALLLGEVGQSLAILAALLINAAVGFAMDYRAETVIASLARLSAPQARVRRDGVERALPAEDLVPGDVILVAAGDRVPADATLAEGACQVDESLLTGESVPNYKRACREPAAGDRDCAVFAGTLVRTGSGVGIVSRTGAATELGRIGALLGATRRPTLPLEERLAALGTFLLWTIATLTLLIIGLGLWQGRPLAPLLQTAIALAVAAIPEGLPSVATLALAAGVRRLQREGIRVRHLGALEALGSITTLCLDKTGTLTLNAMTVERVLLPGHDLRTAGSGWDPAGHVLAGDRQVGAADLPELAALLTAAMHCNEAALEPPGADPRAGGPGWSCLGDPSECALLVLGAKAGLDDPRPGRELLLTQAPGPERPWMLVVARTGERTGAYAKGAPEAILDRCAAESLGQAGRAGWEARARELAGHGLRVFGVADREVPPGGDLAAARQGWRFLGLVGMRDPARPEAPAALAAAHAAGIRTVMITGDHPDTAMAIARELDPELSVHARISPEGKYRLVKDLQAAGEVVAMTGDGVNDAPALRAAVVGVAMGRGTDVARDSATVVLIDESLPALLAGVREGRGAFRNVQKAVDYLLTCSMATMLVVIMASAAGLELPLGPLQILYLNLLMHTFPALGLALEPAERDVLDGPPLPRGAWLLDRARLFLILWHGVILGVATLAVTHWGTAAHGVEHGRTLAFACLAGSLLLHALADRAPEPFGGWTWPRRPILPCFLAVAGALFLLALHFAPLAGVLGMTPLNLHDWVTAGIAIALATVAAEASKAAVRPLNP